MAFTGGLPAVFMCYALSGRLPFELLWGDDGHTLFLTHISRQYISTTRFQERLASLSLGVSQSQERFLASSFQTVLYIYITFYLNTTGTNWWWPEHCASMFPGPCSCVLPGKILVWLKIHLFELVVLHLRPTSTIVKHTWIKQTGTSQLLLASLLVLNERVLFSVT